MKSTLRDVSIVIVTYKGDELTKNCLDSLSLTCGTEPQIVVVDNSPSETTRNMVAAYPNAVYVSSPGNPGFAGGNNRAIPECDRPYILLLNNDTIVHTRESIDRLVEFLDEHPNCGAAQGTMDIPTPQGKLMGACGSFLTPLGFLYAPHAFEKKPPKDIGAYKCFAAIGAFMIFRRKILQQTGGAPFRTHFWAYYEEIDFCHRIWLSGSEVWYVPTPPIDHLCGQTAGQFKHADIMGRYLRNQLFSLSVNLNFWNRLRMVPALKCIILGYGALHLLRGDMAMFRASVRAIFTTRHDRARITAARRQIKRLRKVSDRAIMHTFVRFPPLNYILRSLKAGA